MEKTNHSQPELPQMKLLAIALMITSVVGASVLALLMFLISKEIAGMERLIAMGSMTYMFLVSLSSIWLLCLADRPVEFVTTGWKRQFVSLFYVWVFLLCFLCLGGFDIFGFRYLWALLPSLIVSSITLYIIREHRLRYQKKRMLLMRR